MSDVFPAGDAMREQEMDRFIKAYEQAVRSGMDLRFYLRTDKAYDSDALIEGLEQNQNFCTLLLNDGKSRKDMLGIFAREIYKQPETGGLKGGVRNAAGEEGC